MELRHLRYFVAAAEELSFLRAARRLRVSQPALSKQVRDLEAEIGVPLFVRVARGVQLTPAGEAFLVGARKTLESACCAAASARRAGDGATTRLKLGHGPFVVYGSTIAELLTAFRNANGETEIEVSQLSDRELWPALRENRIDAAITLVASWPLAGYGALRLLDCSATGVLLPAAHPLAARQQLQLRDLRDLTYLYVSSAIWPHLAEAHEAGLRERGLVPERRREWTGPEAWQIAAGDGWTLANEAVAERYGAAVQTIAYRPFTDPPIPTWLTLLWQLDTNSALLPKLVHVASQYASSRTERPPGKSPPR